MELETQNYVEAVIISGPRKGEFITVPQGNEELSSEAENALAAVVADANRLAESTREAVAEAETLLQALRVAGLRSLVEAEDRSAVWPGFADRTLLT